MLTVSGEFVSNNIISSIDDIISDGEAHINIEIFNTNHSTSIMKLRQLPKVVHESI